MSNFLAELFDCELCAECGGDAQHHTECESTFGLSFARCDYPPNEGGTPHPVIAAWRAAEGYEP